VAVDVPSGSSATFYYGLHTKHAFSWCKTEGLSTWTKTDGSGETLTCYKTESECWVRGDARLCLLKASYRLPPCGIVRNRYSFRVIIIWVQVASHCPNTCSFVLCPLIPADALTRNCVIGHSPCKYKCVRCISYNEWSQTRRCFITIAFQIKKKRAIRKSQQCKEGFELNVTHQHLVYANDCVNLCGEDPNIINKSTQAQMLVRTLVQCRSKSLHKGIQ
jgi:hypothetical protein